MSATSTLQSIRDKTERFMRSSPVFSPEINASVQAIAENAKANPDSFQNKENAKKAQDRIDKALALKGLPGLGRVAWAFVTSGMRIVVGLIVLAVTQLLFFIVKNNNRSR